MDFQTLVFLSSGLFLGWSLGANDAANLFGTAVGSRMIKFRTAAIICSVMVVIGATIGGAGAAHTLGSLGKIGAMGGAFTVAFAAALTIAYMVELGLPVSTGQAIVGAIIGWNFFSSSPTEMATLSKIISTWVLSPPIAAAFAIVLWFLLTKLIDILRPGLFALDYWTRIGLILAGAFGSYALGANNIANVMGVFVGTIEFDPIHIFGFEMNSAMQLFALGGIAIGVGVFTYSKKVMMTIGNSLIDMTPLTALIVVLAQSIVLFIFSSQGLSDMVQSIGLPAIPLVPVSSSQAVIGAVIGLALVQRIPIQWRMVGKIVVGWVITPIMAGITCFILLYVVQNLFGQVVI